MVLITQPSTRTVSTESPASARLRLRLRRRRTGGHGGSAPLGQRSRMAWLDALRGVAVLAVVLEHSLDALLPEVRGSVSPWFDFGRYGVFVFFLVSGYVVPASLERRGSVREFWIGRAFRLYPLWAVAAVLGLVFSLVPVWWGMNERLADRPWTSALAHLTMLQDLLGVPNVLNVFWTLSYEMVFYLLVTALFVAGVHRASAGTALAFALAAVYVGVLVPASLLSAQTGEMVIVGAASLMAVGLGLVLSGRPELRRCGVVALAVLGLALIVLNSRIGAAESLSIIATMFAGTALYRLERRQSGWSAGFLVALVPVLTLLAGIRGTLPTGWLTAVAAAWLTFAIGLALRGRRMPRVLTWLGLVSYSVYLLHQLPLQVVRRLAGDPAQLEPFVRLGWAGVIVASVLVLSALSYRHVELPMQRLGRRLTTRKPAPQPAS